MKTNIKLACLTFGTIAIVPFALSPQAQGTLPEPAKADQATRYGVSKSYGKLALSFEANEGQQDSQVKFLSRGSGYNLFLTNREAVLVLSKSEKPAPRPEKKATDATLSQKKSKRQSTVLRTQLVGANPAGTVTGEEELPGKVNYFIGHDPAKWRTDVGTYAKVRYEEVYPGIDLIYYGNQRQLEYDFVVAPGADPSHIRLKVDGARKMYVNGQGQLVVQTAGGAVRWNKPLVYQQAGDKRHQVKGKYTLRPGHELRFEVAAYDTSKPLIIDPMLVYSTYLGGSGIDNGHCIALDSSGNAYVTGDTASTNFPTTAGAFQTTYRGGSDVFVTKLNPTGTALVYSTYLGGDDIDAGQGIAVDTSGNAYVTGRTYSSDFPSTAGAFQMTYGGLQDAFLTELNPTGSGLVYSTYLGGDDLDFGLGIAVDSSGNAFVMGYTYSSNFPTTAGAFQTTRNGGGDAFVTKLNPTASALVYSTYLGGSNGEVGWEIATDSSGNAYVSGETYSSDFPTTAGAFQTTYGGGSSDAFVTQLNPAGSGLVYSTYLGGALTDYGAHGIAVDTSGNAYVVGNTSSKNFPTTAGAFQKTYGGGSSDAFVTKLNPTGTALVYSTYLGGSGTDFGYGGRIAVDTSGKTYVTGDTASRDFPTTTGAIQETYQGGFDAFVTELNPTGSGLVYSTYLGGSGFDVGQGIAADTSGNAYVTGLTGSSNFPTSPGAFQTAFGGSYDAFVAKFSGAVSQITPAGTTCSQFSSGTAETFGSVRYSLNNGLIDRVVPHKFLYWVRVTAPAGDNLFRITQTITSGNFTFFAVIPPGSNVFDSNCISLQQTGSQSGNTVRVRFNAPVAGTYYIAINFDAQNLIGEPAPVPTAVHYDFTTIDVPDSTSGLDLVEHQSP